MNEIEKLRKMLDEAGIPYENRQEKASEDKAKERKAIWGEAGGWNKNQIIYGENGKGYWRLDALWQYGTYGANHGLIEVWGTLVENITGGEPMVMDAKEAFEMIKKDWEAADVGA